MIKRALTAIFTLAAISASAQTYGEIGVTSINYEENVSGIKVKSSPMAIRGIFGYEVHPNFAVEGLVGFGIGDDNVKVNGTSVSGAKFKIDSVFGIYAKPKAQLTSELEGFIRAGFARSKGAVSLSGLNSSSSSSSFSYGLGMSYAVNKTTSINVDFMSYLNKNDSKAAGFTVALATNFKFLN
jgi:opacity protein-like surface antigen